MRSLLFLATVITFFTVCNNKRTDKEVTNEKILNTFTLGQKFDIRTLDTSKLFTTTFKYAKAYRLSDDIYCVVKPFIDGEILTKLFLFYGNDKSSYYQRVIESDKDYFVDVYRTKYGRESSHQVVTNKDSLVQLILDIEVFGGLATFQFEHANTNSFEIFTWNLADKKISLFFREEDVIVYPNKIFAAIARYSIKREKLKEIDNKAKKKQKDEDLERL
jgi:hypothetical protein